MVRWSRIHGGQFLKRKGQIVTTLGWWTDMLGGQTAQGLVTVSMSLLGLHTPPEAALNVPNENRELHNGQAARVRVNLSLIHI